MTVSGPGPLSMVNLYRDPMSCPQRVRARRLAVMRPTLSPLNRLRRLSIFILLPAREPGAPRPASRFVVSHDYVNGQGLQTSVSHQGCPSALRSRPLSTEMPSPGGLRNRHVLVVG